jgi:hypothetical protein
MTTQESRQAALESLRAKSPADLQVMTDHDLIVASTTLLLTHDEAISGLWRRTGRLLISVTASLAIGLGIGATLIYHLLRTT